MLAIAPGWELAVERGPDWLLVRILKAPEARDAPPLADELWEQLCRHFTYRLVLELNQIVLLDSYLIGQLVQLYKRICEHDGVMRVCGLSAYNRRVLHTCNLADHFPEYQDREEAVMGVRRPRQPR
ncbi:MAG: STAS domain-containing protein [Patescibacteria group bacterium]|nr:STAS domain-containing protein [Patescibacteria group bacterium]